MFFCRGELDEGNGDAYGSRLPFALSALAFFGQIAWEGRSGGWGTALVVAFVVLVVVIALTGAYSLNQSAVRSRLEPRRQELETLLASLKDETPAAN